MITKYFSKVSVKFNPFTPGAKPARLFLSRIPTSLKAQCQVEYKVLTAGLKETPSVQVTFTDKNVMQVDPELTSFVDLSNYFDSHSRKLAIKDAISDLGSVVSVNNNEILWSVVVLAGEVAGQDILHTIGVSLLGINRGTRDVRSHGITASVWVLHGQPWVVLWWWLWVPNITSVTQKLTGVDSISNSLGITNGSSGSVDQPGTVLHLGDQILVEQAKGSLVQWTVDGDSITLGDHVLQLFNSLKNDVLAVEQLGSVVDLLDCSLRQWLVVEVQKLFGVEGHQSLENSVPDSACTDSTNYLIFQVVLVLGGTSNVPGTLKSDLVGWNEVSDQIQDTHNDMFGNRDDIGASDLSHCQFFLVGSGQVNVVRSNTSSDTDLQVLGLGDSLLSDVAWEKGGSDDDLSILNLFFNNRVWTIFVVGRHQFVAMRLHKLSDAQLILNASQ